MIFLLNVLFRFLHMLMVFLPSQSAFKIWLRQMAEDALLMEHMATDIRLAGELFRLKSRYSGTRLVSDFWNITDRNKVVTAAELMEPGGQYIERIAPEDNRPGAYKPDLLVTRSP
ncbi:hypothetical protein HP612_004631, partial [Salmonella enterica]|nr:hypothetical protein [Salmonella enterica]